jgi:hypothetical protein
VQRSAQTQKMKKLMKKFESKELSKEQMKAVQGGECTNFGAYLDCLTSGVSPNICYWDNCYYLE